MIWLLFPISLFLYLFYEINQDERRASNFFLVIFAFGLLGIVFYFINNSKFSSKDIWGIVFLIIAFSVINVIFRNFDLFTANYLAKVFRFCATVLLLAVSTKNRAGKSFFYSFCICSQIIIGLLLYQATVVKSTYYTYSSLLLGFKNPNTAGIWAYLLFCSCIICCFYFKKIIARIYFIFGAIVSIWLILLTYCRSALIGVLFFVLYLFLSYLSEHLFAEKYKPIFLRIIRNVSLIIPFIFPVLYLVMASTGFNSLTLFGKTFYSGRNIHWIRDFGFLSDHLLVGAYKEVSNGTGESQLLNIYIDVLCSYGTIVFFLMLTFYRYISQNTENNIKNNFNSIAYCAFLSTFVVGAFEAGFITGAGGISYWACLFLMLANFNDPIWENENYYEYTSN